MTGSDDKLIINNSGIHSLSGFAFQIRVFAFFALCITKEYEQVEFETLDDITTKITKNNLDTKEDSFCCKATYKDKYKLIQVKRSSLSQENFNNTLYNWILQTQTNNSLNIDKYILFTSDEHDNIDLMFKKSAIELYELAMNTKKIKSSSIKVKIKNRFTDKFEEFQKIYNEIKSKYEFISNQNIDDLIFKQGKFNLRYNETNIALYKERLELFMNTIQNKVLSDINNKSPYILNTEELLKIYEDITTSVNSKNYWPPYYSFKKTLDYVSLKNSDISNLRETKQLISCNLAPANTIERLKQMIYYQHFRTLSAENGMQSKPKSIEMTTYNNYQSVIEELSGSIDDKPKNRLLRTEQRNNGNAPTDEIRCGSCIYLTGDNITNQISWEDDNNVDN